jgi:hypothetical protein
MEQHDWEDRRMTRNVRMGLARNRRGAILIDAMTGIYVLALGTAVYVAAVCSATQSYSMVNNGGKALAAADMEIEAIKSLTYGNANYNSLIFYQLIDESSSTSPFSFTNATGNGTALSNLIPGATGTVTVTDESTTQRKIIVAVTWTTQTGPHTVTLTTELAQTN